MKNTFRFFGIIALVAIIGVSFVACNDGSGNGGSGKRLTISGIDLTGDVTVIINTAPMGGTVAYGTTSDVTSGTNVTFDLKVVNLSNMANPFTDTNWDGNGLFYILVYNRTPQQVMAGQAGPVKSFGPIDFSNETTVVTW